MNRLIARIHFRYEGGPDVAHFNYDTEFSQLGLPVHTDDDRLTFLSVGNVINLGDKQFKVVDINISVSDYFGDQFNPEIDANLYITCKIDDID